MGRQYRFKIEAYTPETLPMERLAEYMLRFAKLLGEPQHVRFVDIEKGSAVLLARTDDIAVSRVERRLSEVAHGRGEQAALRALQELDDMLANDNSVGELTDDTGAEIIHFLGRDRSKPLEYGPFREDAVLEGVVIKIGGKGKTVPIWLLDNDIVYRCVARRSLARQIAKHYDSGLLRVSGAGSWTRLGTGAWLMRSFEIKSFELLDDAPLVDVIKRLQDIEGADWGEDPVGELLRLRSGEGLN